RWDVRASMLLFVLSDSGLYGSLHFFFQAVDGIRDATVTGVQTCALPILFFSIPREKYSPFLLVFSVYLRPLSVLYHSTVAPAMRSEGRRVGKQSGSRKGALERERCCGT